MIVVADTSPINYLVLMGCAHLLPDLFGEVIVPQAVFTELQSKHAPESVRKFVRAAPNWLRIEVVQKEALERVSEPELHAGEREAIALAELLAADYVIMDEKAGRRIALRRGVPVIGTLGVLEKADAEGMLGDFSSLLDRLEETSFYIRAELREALLRRHRERKRP